VERSIGELVRIAGFGGGFTLDARKYNLEQVIRVLNAAADSGARIHIANAGDMTTDQLVRLAGLGKGCVTFDLF
jgi:hypothetical protein